MATDVTVVSVDASSEAAPWIGATAEHLVLRRQGDELLDDGVALALDAIGDRSAVVGGHRTKGAGRWGGQVPAPTVARLSPDVLLAAGATPLSGLLLRRDALPDHPEVPVAAPGGTSWLLAHLATQGAIGTVEATVAVVGHHDGDDTTSPEALAHLASSRLASELGVARALRRRLLSATFLAGESHDPARPPHGWWAPIVERLDHAEVEALATDLHWALERQSDRIRAVVDDVTPDGIDEGLRRLLDRSAEEAALRIAAAQNGRLADEVQWLHAEVARRDRRIAELEGAIDREPPT